MQPVFQCRRSIIGVACLWAVAAPGIAANAQELRYAFTAGQKVGYSIEITAELPDSTENMAGVIVLNAGERTAEGTPLSCSGGLNKTIRNKEAAVGRRGFGRPGGPPGFPGGFGPPPGFPPSPFGRAANPYLGLAQSTSQINLSARGEVTSMRGSTQLPYLLGNLSALVFEPLPEQVQPTWKLEHKTAISEGGRSNRPPFFPPVPFGQDEPEKSSTAAEVTTYTLKTKAQDLITLEKSYVLKRPAANTDDSTLEINGEGTWRFNQNLNLPESLDFRQKLTISKENSTTSVPMTIKYHRMSDDELAMHAAESEKRAAENKQRLQTLQEQQKNAPLSSFKKNTITEKLQSNREFDISFGLQMLKNQNPHPDDRDLVPLIRKHLNSADKRVKQRAEELWEKWQALSDASGAAAAGEGDSTTEASDDDNPFATDDDKTDFRTWTDNSGKFRIDARFVSVSDDQVVLQRKDGKQITLPLSRLSTADRKLAKELKRKQPQQGERP